MSFTVFLGNLPAWVTADDIKGWLTADDLVADSIKVIRNHETQESKGFAFVEAPTTEEMQSIIRRFDRAPLEGKLLRANPAQPAKGRVPAATTAASPREIQARVSRSLRQELGRLNGEKFNSTALNSMARRIRDELHVRTVTH